MLTDEQKSRLNPEQLAIAEDWEREREERLDDITKMSEAQMAGNKEEFQRLLDKMRDDSPSHCAHERSIWKDCMECREIEMLLHPELFCKECEEPGNKYMNPLDDDGVCEDCRE